MIGIPQTLDRFDRQFTADWRFETARYAILFYADEEDLTPEDSFCEQDDIDRARSGNLHDWFCAVVTVYSKEDNRLLGIDTLGACSYESLAAFTDEHRKYAAEARAAKARGVCMGSYFPQMVREAISQARVLIATESEDARRA
jgi:hypothetical protein